MANFITSSWHAAFDHPAIDPTRFLSVPSELIDSEAPFALRLRNGFAGLGGYHSRRFARAANHFVGDCVQGVSSGERRSRSPHTQSYLRGLQRFFRVAYAGNRRLAQSCLVHGADHRRLGPIRGLSPLACYEKSELLIHLIPPPKPSPRGLPRSTSAPLPRALALDDRLRSQRSGDDASRWLQRKRRFLRQTPLGTAR